MYRSGSSERIAPAISLFGASGEKSLSAALQSLFSPENPASSFFLLVPNSSARMAPSHFALDSFDT